MSARVRLRAGAARVDITPAGPISMAGFASRTAPSRGVARPLHLRALLLEESGDGPRRRTALVSADLLNWGVEQVPELRRRVTHRFGVPETSFLLAATHSHSGPQTTQWVARSIGVADPNYLALLERQLIEGLEQAEASLTPVRMRRTRGRHDLGVYRRRSIDGPAPRADPEGPRDPELTVVEVQSTDGFPVAILLHTTCHPVINADHLLTDEYPGSAACLVEQELQTVALFFQGCCGDVNPRAVGRRGPLEAEREGGALGRIVLDALSGPMDALPPARLGAAAGHVALPFRHLPDIARLRQAAVATGVEGEWGRAFLEHPDHLRDAMQMDLQRLRLAHGLELLAMNAEVSVGYGLWVKECWPGALPVAYANGMIGYTPTSHQIQRGGYEAMDSARYYLLSGHYLPEIEELIRDGVTALMCGEVRPQ